MTPEERFTNIERVLERTAEQISKLQVEQAEQSKLQSQQAEQIRNLIANGDKQNEAIRSLIVVSRTVLSSIQEMRAAQEKMIEEARELSKHTDEKLNILIDTVDRIIRQRALLFVQSPCSATRGMRHPQSASQPDHFRVHRPGHARLLGSFDYGAAICE